MRYEYCLCHNILFLQRILNICVGVVDLDACIHPHTTGVGLGILMHSNCRLVCAMWLITVRCYSARRVTAELPSEEPDNGFQGSTQGNKQSNESLEIGEGRQDNTPISPRDRRAFNYKTAVGRSLSLAAATSHEAHTEQAISHEATL